MKALDFFFKQITAGQAEVKRQRIEKFIDEYLDKPYTMSYVAYSNIIYCCDKSSCSIDYLDHDNYEVGDQRKWFSIESSLKDEYKNWIVDVFPKETDIVIGKNSVGFFISKVKEYESDINNLEEPLKGIFKFLIEDFKSLLIKYYPDRFNVKLFNEVHFVTPVESRSTLNTDASEELTRIYNLEFEGKTICTSITVEEWRDFFINGKIPLNQIKLNFSTSVACQAFDFLADKYCASTKKDFYLFIQNSKVVLSNRNTFLTERNISKSADTYNDSTDSYLKLLKG